MSCRQDRPLQPADPDYVHNAWRFLTGRTVLSGHQGQAQARERSWWVTGAVGIVLTAALFGITFAHADMTFPWWCTTIVIGLFCEGLWFTSATHAGGINRALINTAARYHDALLRQEAEHATTLHLVAHALDEDMPRVCHCPGLLHGRPATIAAMGLDTE